MERRNTVISTDRLIFSMRERKGLLFLIVGTGFAAALAGPAVQVFYFVFCTVLAVLILINRLADPVLGKILMAAFILRLALALVQVYTAFDLPGAGDESLNFEYYGWVYAQAWRAGMAAEGILRQYIYYSGLIGVFYYFFGRALFIAHLINVLLGLAIVYLTFLLARFLSLSRRVSLIAALLGAFFPMLVVFSAITLRENLLILFTLLSFYYFTKWLRVGGYLYIFGTFISTAAMALFHGAMFLVNWVQFLSFIFFNPREQRYRFTIRQALFVAALVLLLVLLISTETVYFHGLRDLINLTALESVQWLVTRSPGRTSYLGGLVPQSYFDVLWHTPIRAFYFMFTPFPWMIQTAADLLVFFEALSYFLLVVFSFSGVKQLWKKWQKRSAVVTMVVTTLSIILIFAWGTVNFGTAMRHRAKAAPFLIVMASAGLAASPRVKRLLSDEQGNWQERGWAIGDQDLVDWGE